ncbi:MAG: hypothetical protein Q8O67_16355 [Deltaproteobacteria bacterium]|nr:hypothetical protein [Deltaproteobacteria bacterium]
MTLPSTRPRLLPPPLPADDEGVPFSAALTDIVTAIEDSMSVRLDLLRERLFDETRSVALRSLLWIGSIVSLGAAWLATIIAFTIWVANAGGAIVAALWVAAIHFVAAFGFFIAVRTPRHPDPVGLR